MKLIPLLLLSLVLPLAAGELVPSQIPKGAKWLLHLDFEAMRASETGKALFKRIQDDHGVKLEAMGRMLSLRPLDDFSGVTLYGDGGKDRAVILIKGVLDRGHLVALVKAADDYRADRYREVTIHTWKDKGKIQHAAFFGDGLLVFSHYEELLKMAVDELEMEGGGAMDSFFTDLGVAPMVRGMAEFPAIEMGEDEARILGMMEVLRLAAIEDDGRFSLMIETETKDEESADVLGRIIDGVIAMGQALDLKLEGLDLRSEVGVLADTAGVAAEASLPTEDAILFVERAADEQAAKARQEEEP